MGMIPEDDRFIPIRKSPRELTSSDVRHPYEITDYRDYTDLGEGIDLRDAFAEIIEPKGHYVLLRRTERKLHCKCWNPINQDADDKCVYCGGTGRVSIIEKHLTRKMRTMSIAAPARDLDDLDPSNFSTPDFAFFFKYDVHPKVQDLIYEVSWNDDNTPKYVLSEYRINYSEAMRDRRGRIEYYRVACIERPINRAIHTVQIRRLRDYIIGEDKFYFSLDF